MNDAAVTRSDRRRRAQRRRAPPPPTAALRACGLARDRRSRSALLAFLLVTLIVSGCQRLHPDQGARRLPGADRARRSRRPGDRRLPGGDRAPAIALLAPGGAADPARAPRSSSRILTRNTAFLRPRRDPARSLADRRHADARRPGSRSLRPARQGPHRPRRRPRPTAGSPTPQIAALRRPRGRGPGLAAASTPGSSSPADSRFPELAGHLGRAQGLAADDAGRLLLAFPIGVPRRSISRNMRRGTAGPTSSRSRSTISRRCPRSSSACSASRCSSTPSACRARRRWSAA